MNKIPFDQFPELLKEIPDPPKYLYTEGILPNNETKFLCVVGSRKFSSYGQEVCEYLIENLRGYPITIVSGLAIGMDSMAHESALKVGLKTIAVPGSGLDRKVLYPRINLNLASRILNSGGALLSEFEPLAKSTLWSFPQRNRIMAGMSHATLLIEATEKSGTLITAKFATEYNRDLLAVPGPILAPSSYGPHLFIRLGAIPIRTPEEILEALHLTTLFPVSSTGNKQSISKEIRTYTDCSPEELKLIELLQSPLGRDELLRKSEMPMSQTNALLSLLEIKGILKESLGEFHLT